MPRAKEPAGWLPGWRTGWPAFRSAKSLAHYPLPDESQTLKHRETNAEHHHPAGTVLQFSAPLFVILAIRTPAGQQKTAAALWLTALFSAIGLFVFLRTARGLAANAITIKSASPKDSDAMSYLVAYLVPLLWTFISATFRTRSRSRSCS